LEPLKGYYWLLIGWEGIGRNLSKERGKFSLLERALASLIGLGSILRFKGILFLILIGISATSLFNPLGKGGITSNWLGKVGGFLRLKEFWKASRGLEVV